MSLTNQVILITGCSSGIGHALAVAAHQAGHRVAASARRPESVRELTDRGLFTVALDVTDLASVERAVDEVVARFGRLDILVNNAGFGLIGPVAEMPLDRFRHQLETNVVGPLALMQKVTPLMAAQGGGRIINIGSVSGITATPYAGAYCASKAALHLLSDAARVELAPFHIGVMVVQPGGIASRFGDTAGADLDRYRREGSLYRKGVSGIEARARMSQGSPTTADDFAAATLKAMCARRLAPVFRYGHGSTLLPTLKALLPTGRLDAILSKKFNVRDIAD